MRFTLLSRRRSPRRRVIIVLLLGVIGVLGCGAGDRLFYWPNRLVYNDPASEKLEYEEVTFEASDGTKLNGWFVPAQGGQAPRGTVIYYHGNAQNLTAHWEFVSWLPRRGWNLFLFDYRGYGKSEGEVTREGTYLDSVAALEYVLARPDVDRSRLVAYGQSLGGACLLSALGESNPTAVRGIAVDSTFYSYPEVGEAKLKEMWWTWLVAWPMSRWLVTDAHSPSQSLDRLAGVPLLVIHGDADAIVPYSQGERVFEKAGEPKSFIRVPGGEHCDAVAGHRFGRKYQDVLAEFFASCVEGAEPVNASERTAGDVSRAD